ncbi:hypothetical protein IVA86_00320 [Bradyrhizobium sp. 146]|uniref:hypothetical protein n=1 Tax=Bradyrhizobium sp. 146 TaxID=2782622 RepID=UPI001FFA3CF2|nr:hypothetical protein [Bradyrhizobium sp. 146]MCK1699923.1 hypothetical protein [Bradyrhizobium sp. 146]
MSAVSVSRDDVAASETADAVTSATEPERPPHRGFPVTDFWQGTILVEEEISPEVTLASEPRYDDEERTLYLVAEENVPDVDPSDGQAVGVKWNGYKLGDLDTERTQGTAVVV